MKEALEEIVRTKSRVKGLFIDIGGVVSFWEFHPETKTWTMTRFHTKPDDKESVQRVFDYIEKLE